MVREAGNSWALFGLLSLGAVGKLACEGGGSRPDKVEDTLSALLADVGPEVVHPTLVRAASAAEILESRVLDWQAAERNGDGAAARLEAQAAWWSLMAVWQEAEVLQIGPAGSSLTTLGGEDLRDEVYSWPTVNQCRVDQETVYATWDDPDWLETHLVNVKGLDALEVLLYASNAENDCPSQVDINADGSWDTLGEDGVAQHRADYAVVLAAHVATTVRALADRWDPAQGNFGAQLATPADPYDSAQTALNAVFDALFYLEIVTKDRKLGYALGTGACAGDSCIDDIESPLAGGSHQWIGANLVAFRALFTGGSGAGLDDLLGSIGEKALADAVLVALDQADAAVLSVPLDAATPADVQTLYDAVKGVTDLLKGDVATVLVLQVPAEAAGDAD